MCYLVRGRIGSWVLNLRRDVFQEAIGSRPANGRLDYRVSDLFDYIFHGGPFVAAAFADDICCASTSSICFPVEKWHLITGQLVSFSSEEL